MTQQKKAEIKSSQFSSYAEYLAFQKKTARETVARTLQFRQYPRILNILKAFFPEAQSVLLIGCRHAAEYNFFRKNYKDVTAIDLFDEGPIINCDMSKIHDHPEIGARQYDVFVSIRSLAHCVDFEGFINGLKSHARLGIYCFTKAGFTRDKWFCSDAEILRPDATPELFQATFSPFQLRHLQYQWNQDECNIEFICRR